MNPPWNLRPTIPLIKDKMIVHPSTCLSLAALFTAAMYENSVATFEYSAKDKLLWMNFENHTFARELAEHCEPPG
jgi:hypothetical protein